jgi:hypothetical protein
MPKTIVVLTTGKNGNGDVIAQFLITWSFKEK